VRVSGTETNFYRRHSAQFSGEGPSWVLASGVANAETIVIRPAIRRPPPSPPAAPRKKTDDDDDDDDDDTDAAKSSATNGTPRRSWRTNRTEVATSILLQPAEYTVRLYFAEPERVNPGERVFDVALQGRPVLQNMDIAAAGGLQRGIVREFRDVVVTDELTIKLDRSGTGRYGPVISGVEMIVEEVMEAVPAGE
jgi:hypothetical protein